MAKTTTGDNAFFMKCKGIAVVVAAVSGLILGLLNWFKEVRDPNVKVGYQELAKQVENVSGDVQKLAATVRVQAEEISTIQNWIINERDKRGALPGPAVTKILKTIKAAKPAPPAPPTRKPAPWTQVQQQTSPKGW